MKYYYRKKRGFIAFVTLFLLAIFALMGFAYWFSSRTSTDLLFIEAQRFKARNYAQAGIERARIYMCNVLQLTKNSDMRTNFNKKDFEKSFEDGGYRVTSIKPFSKGNVYYLDVPHKVNGKVIGHFDMWEVTSEGYTTKTKFIVEIKTIIRIYRDNIVY